MGTIGNDCIFRTAEGLDNEKTFLMRDKTFPENGIVTQWCINVYNNMVGDNYRTAKLKIFRISVSNYQLIGESNEEILLTDDLNIFNTNIPIQEGDILAIYTGCPGCYRSIEWGPAIHSDDGGNLYYIDGDAGTTPISSWTWSQRGIVSVKATYDCPALICYFDVT